MSSNRIVLVGLAQALGTALYVSLVVLLMRGVERALRSAGPEPQGDTYWGMVTFLLLFVVSACVTGAMVLGYPATLVFRQRVRDAVLLVGATLGWLALLLVGSLAVLAFQVARLS